MAFFPSYYGHLPGRRGASASMASGSASVSEASGVAGEWLPDKYWKAVKQEFINSYSQLANASQWQVNPQLGCSGGSRYYQDTMGRLSGTKGWWEP